MARDAARCAYPRSAARSGAATAAMPADAPDRYPLDEMLDRVEARIEGLPAAAMFGLAAEGHDSLYEQLVSCVLSIRTYDETSWPAARALFERASTPEAMLGLTRETLVGLIHACTYPEQKADTILVLSRAIVDAHGGETPTSFEALTAFKGVGPKCANLALGVALGVPAISVDVHVHRVVNRWGLVATKEPKATLAALERVVPRGRWVDVNRLLMPFGKHVCVNARPRCGTCPVRRWCDHGRGSDGDRA